MKAPGNGGVGAGAGSVQRKGAVSVLGDGSGDLSLGDEEKRRMIDEELCGEDWRDDGLGVPSGVSVSGAMRGDMLCTSHRHQVG